MGRKIIITEYLEMDIDAGQWHCSTCGKMLIEAETNYKKGCLVNSRDPREIHNPVFEAEFAASRLDAFGFAVAAAADEKVDVLGE